MLARIAALTFFFWGSYAVSQMQRAQLSYSPISAPETIVAGPGATAAGPSGNLILPPGNVRIPSGGSVDLPIGSDTLKLGWKVGPDFTITSGKKTQPLHPIARSYGLQPAIVTLSGGRRYLLAFPVARLNSTPEGLLAIVWYRSGSAQTTNIDGELVWFYDANTDGVFDVRSDMMRVGPAMKAPMFAPIGSHFATSKAIYHIDDLSSDGKTLKYSPYSGPAGKLRVVFPSSNTELGLVLLSSDAGMNASIAAGDKMRPDVNLIPAQYRAQFGVVSLNGQGTLAAVIDPATLPPITVAADQTVTYQLGPPHTLTFAAAREGDKFKIDPASFKTAGKAGEQYLQIHWTQPPEVSVLANGKSRPDGKMAFGEGGRLREYSGTVPANSGPIKIIITGTLDGLGAVGGEVVVE